MRRERTNQMDLTCNHRDKGAPHMARKVIGAAKSVVGPTGSRRRRWATLLSLVVIVAASLIFMRTVLAVHNLVFELEGNATTQGATTHDWDQVFTDSQSAPPNTASGAVAVSFANDGAQNATIFTGGGSKDPQDLNQWAWKDQSGGLPDKDNLQDAFAARYSLPISQACTAPAGSLTCEVIYFGSDRFDNSGDAQQGFWFFQNPVSTKYDTDGNGTPDADCPISIGGGTGFCDPRTGDPAHHADGDLLIISDFSNGGTTSSITIYKWNSAVSGNLELLEQLDAAKCGAGDPNDGFCGIVNPTNGTATGGWAFTDKGGNHTYLQGELYEGGVNLSALGLGDECFSSVAAESRSSTSPTATLKDFVIGQFANCSATMTTTPSVGAGATVSPGTSVTDTAVVQGAGTSNPPTPTGNVTFFLCSQLATGTCDGTTGRVGTQVGNPKALADSSPPAGEASATSDAVSPTSPGRYCFRAEWPGDGNYPAIKHSGSNNDECFIVQDTTSASSAQNWLPNDTGSITSAHGTALNGTLTFQLYTGLTCAAGSEVPNQLYTFTLNNEASGTNHSTSNTTFKVLATADYSWKMVFVSSDANVVGTSKCEKTSLTITN